MRRLLTRAAMVVGLALFLPASASAQNPFSAAFFVNNVMVTHFEIDQRIRLLRALNTQAPDLRDVAIQSLTEDAVRKGLIDELGLTVREEAYEEALTQYAEQRQMSVGGLRSRLDNAGVAREAFDDFLQVQLMWREIVRERFRERASPTESDIQNILNFSAGSARESVFLRELAIPFAERGLQGARDLANRIRRDVANGASFASLARQYSRTRSAPRGGALDWAPVNRLPAQIATRVLTLSRGEVSAPLEVPAGVILFQLVDIREDDADARDDVLATYMRLDVPLPANPGQAQFAAANATAQELVAQLKGCDDALGRVEEFGPLSGRYGPDPVAEIPPEFAMVMVNLDAGEAGFTLPGEDGVTVLILCNRSVDVPPEQIDELRTQVFNQRLTRFADDFIQELLSDAVIRQN